MFHVNCDLCNKDYICVKECPVYAISVDEKSGYPTARENMPELCINCGHCVVLCPTGAASHVSHPESNHAKVDLGLMPTPEQMEVLIKTRRSARQFQQRPVPHEIIMKILEVCNYAPSAANRQEIRWIVVEKPETTKKLFGMFVDWLHELLAADPQNAYAIKQLGRIEILGVDPIFRTAVQMAICVMPSANDWSADADIALTYFEAYAHSLGLAVCWNGLFVQAIKAYQPIRKFLGIKDNEKVPGVQLFGYPKLKINPNLPPRKPLDVSIF